MRLSAKTAARYHKAVNRYKSSGIAAALLAFAAAAPLLHAADDSAMGFAAGAVDGSKGIQDSLDKGDMGGASESAASAFDKIASEKGSGDAVSAAGASRGHRGVLAPSAKSIDGAKGSKMPALAATAASKKAGRGPAAAAWIGGAAAVGGLAGGYLGYSFAAAVSDMTPLVAGAVFTSSLPAIAACAALGAGAAALTAAAVVGYYAAKDALNKEEKIAAPVK